MAEIYKIIDREDENAYCTETIYKHRGGAEKALKRMMERHVRSIMMKVVKMTGTVRGKNVGEFNNAIESVATPRYYIKSVRMNTDW
jgi:site-specific DNA-adenine methylase